MVRDVSFENAHGAVIDGTLKQKNPKRPLIIVCPGYRATKNHPTIKTLTDMLYALGETTFSFTFSHRAKGVNVKEQVEDINDIINHFHEYEKIIILAISFGAISGSITAAQSKISGLITLNGFFAKHQLGARYFTLYALMRMRALMSSKDNATKQYIDKTYKPHKITMPTLVMHAGKDKHVSIRQSKDFYKEVSGKKEFYTIQNAEHMLLDDVCRRDSAEKIHSWIEYTY